MKKRKNRAGDKMKITKYPQACLLVETEGKRILIDPGTFGFAEEMLKEDWTDIDIILITHRHDDHCHQEAINTIMERDNAKLYTTQEVVCNYQLINPNIVKEGDVIAEGNIKIEVVKAVHGFLTAMKYRQIEVQENVGFIIDDGKKRLYATSDTINFNHDYKCDILAMPFNGNGLTMGIIDGVAFAKDINPELLLPIHMQHPDPRMNPDIKLLEKEIQAAQLKYRILAIGETVTVN